MSHSTELGDMDKVFQQLSDMDGEPCTHPDRYTTWEVERAGTDHVSSGPEGAVLHKAKIKRCERCGDTLDVVDLRNS
jgi:hypothetical protein